MILIGDVHGEFRRLKTEILQKVKDENLIILGDVGLGFGGMLRTQLELETLSAALEENNNRLYLLRGNHDNPDVWNLNFGSYNNITFVGDYEVLTIEDKKILFVGGGISIDRCGRKEGISWWKSENVSKIPTDLTKEVDILATHAPLRSKFSIPANKDLLNYYIQKDPKLVKDIEKEEKILQSLDDLVDKKWWVSAHFHRSDRNYTNDCNYINLDILETFEIR